MSHLHPHIGYELSGMVQEGDHEITICCTDYNILSWNCFRQYAEMIRQPGISFHVWGYKLGGLDLYALQFLIDLLYIEDTVPHVL